MDYYTGLSFEQHLQQLHIDRTTIDPEHFDYCIRPSKDANPIKLSLLAVNNLSEAIGWFDKKLEDHYPEELSFYLANITLESPKDDEGKKELKTWEKAMEIKRKENKNIAEAFKFADTNRKKIEKDLMGKGIAKEYGHFTVNFE